MILIGGFVPDVGLTPSITADHSDKAGRRVRPDYTAPVTGDGSTSNETLLVLVEVSADALPGVPFVVQGTTRSVTVTTVPNG